MNNKGTQLPKATKGNSAQWGRGRDRQAEDLKQNIRWTSTTSQEKGNETNNEVGGKQPNEHKDITKGTTQK